MAVALAAAGAANHAQGLRSSRAGLHHSNRNIPIDDHARQFLRVSGGSHVSNPSSAHAGELRRRTLSLSSDGNSKASSMVGSGAAKKRRQAGMLKDKDKADDKKKQAVRQRAKVKSEGAAPLPDHMDREKTKAFKLSKESDELRKEIVALLDAAVKASPTKKPVVLQFYVNRIFEVSEQEERVKMDLYLKLNWKSDAWVGRSDDEFQADPDKFKKGWWFPGVEVTNSVECKKEVEEKEAYWVEFPDDGILAYTQRYSVTVHSPMDQHDFPFDQQTIPITFESFHWKESDMTLLRLKKHAFQLSPKLSAGKRWYTVGPDITLDEWAIDSVEVKETSKIYRFEDRTYSQIVVNVAIRRIFWRFLLRTLTPLIAVTAIAWSAFAMNPALSAKRTLAIVGCFAANVLFHMVVNECIAKVNYLTKLDYIIYGCYLFNAVNVLETLVAYVYAERLGERDTALLIDDWCFIGFVIAFVLFFVIWIGPPTYRDFRRRWWAVNQQRPEPTNRF